MQEQQPGHIPVLLNEVLEFLQPRAGGQYVDGTLGGGGHTEAILERSAPDGKVLGIDTDAEAIERVSQRLAGMVQSGRLRLAQGNFAELARIVKDEAGFVSSVDGILLDLGFSSYQMEDPERGFSFSADGPLDMRLDRSQELTAFDLVNSASEQELADIFWKYGEERRSRQIAWRIVRERAKAPIRNTAQLARLAAAGMPHKPGTIHPATRIFQALRIAVNGELERLQEVLPQMLEVLSAGEHTGGSGGRMVVISFHSLEDRLVKGFMRREASDCICPPGTPVCVCGHKARLRILTPRPVTPTSEEVNANPRARSAKLRAAEVVVAPE
ncbi:MAG TPA: 16S rRNA (cytosine(1402)-N(4))-methyltransferase RsmH [Ktedonobacteraceae bacterium]|jgi:16S rRNA (cytosine1402-N4)-methyltransferase|nr:16S rRNA (cytosine(1402)-N(4))-methyltransferase RsmH [Ktedonobacteraceae bacterium]